MDSNSLSAESSSMKPFSDPPVANPISMHTWYTIEYSILIANNHVRMLAISLLFFPSTWIHLDRESSASSDVHINHLITRPDQAI